MRILRRVIFGVVASVLLGSGLFLAAQAPAPPTGVKAPPPVEVVVHREVMAILRALRQDRNFAKARRAIDRLRDRVVLWAPLDKPGIFREVIRARRLIHGLDQADRDKRPVLLDYLMEQEGLATAIVFAMSSRDRKRSLFRVVNELREAFDKRAAKYAYLTAALAIVHDRPKGGNRPGPVPLFDYFTKMRGKMFFDIRTTPPELLKFVVDVDVSMKDMVWALTRHAGESNVGERYTDPPYDMMHFAQGKPKRIKGKPYTLPNLRKYGGICGDRGYFVANIGSAIGVPAVAANGTAGGIGHCWVGFLERRGQKIRWNFRYGRSYVFERVRGMVHDPQTRRSVPDSDIMLTAELAGTTAKGREQATALIDCAERLSHMRRFPTTGRQPEPLLPGADQKPRVPSPKHELAFVEAALRRNRAEPRGWRHVAKLGARGDLDYATMAKWAASLERLCGRDYPDFSARLLADMISSIKDVKHQDRHWTNAARYFKWRKDLAAELKIRQGKMWEGAGDRDRAYRLYRAVAFEYVNDSPVVLKALKALDRLCREGKREILIPKTYAAVWKRAQQPANIDNRRASNWYRIARAYLRVLKRYEMKDTAEKVRRKIASVMG